MKKLLVLALLCLMLAPRAQSQEECPMPIGTNYHFLGSGVFKDLKLTSTHFFTRNASFQNDGNDWESSLISQIETDAAGYPMEAPFDHPETGNPQILAFTVGGYEEQYLAGDYVMLYEGEGEMSIQEWIPAEITNASPGRIEFRVDQVDGNGIHFEIHRSERGNHIRNIHVFEARYENDFETDPLIPEFVEKSANFSALRFMDWTRTNNSTLVNWEDRVSPEFHNQADDHGISYELLIDLSNRMGRDVWINVPHQADANYIRQMARLFRDLLDPDITIYLEYSNECWNFIFEQTAWLGEIRPQDTYIRNYGYFSKQVFDIWIEEFGAEGRTRLKNVLAGHDYFVAGAIDYIIEQDGNADIVDAVSYPGYVGLGGFDYDELDALGENATVADVFRLLRATMHDPTEGPLYWMRVFKEIVADVYDKEFVMYEGGQHLTPRNFGEQAPYLQALWDAQIAPEMYDLYMELMTFFRDELEVTLFMNYTLTGARESSFGSWGVLEDIYAEAPWPAKYQAILDFQCFDQANEPNDPDDPEDPDDPGVVTSVDDEADPTLLSVYPNPSDGTVYLSIGTLPVASAPVYLFDHTGRLIQTYMVSGETEIRTVMPKGMYMVRLGLPNSPSRKLLVH